MFKAPDVPGTKLAVQLETLFQQAAEVSADAQHLKELGVATPLFDSELEVFKATAFPLIGRTATVNLQRGAVAHAAGPVIERHKPVYWLPESGRAHDLPAGAQLVHRDYAAESEMYVPNPSRRTRRELTGTIVAADPGAGQLMVEQRGSLMHTRSMWLVRMMNPDREPLVSVTLFPQRAIKAVSHAVTAEN